MCSNEGFWCAKTNCSHDGLCGDCRNGKIKKDDLKLFHRVHNFRLQQNTMLTCCLYSPLFPFGALGGFLCEGNSYAKYKRAQGSEAHRFKECVCFNIVLAFTMEHDPKYREGFTGTNETTAALPVVNAMMNGTDNVGVEDITVNTAEAADDENDRELRHLGRRK